MDKVGESFLGGSLVKIEATNGSTVNLTLIVKKERDEDTLRKWSKKILLEVEQSVKT